jgi:ABC-type glutathione transport system ATPase component
MAVWLPTMRTEQAVKRAAKPALVRVSGLSKRYVQRGAFSRRKFVIDAIREVELEIQPMCLTALVGESGSGKSTLARCLAMLERPDKGEIWFEGEEVSRRRGHELASLRPKIQMIFQDSAGALNPRFSAAEIIAEPLEIQRLASGQELRRRACELMEEVGLSPEWANRHSLEFSAGQRQRLAIARAIALQPAFLILDESLSKLDLITQGQILQLLSDLQTAHALTYLLICHDLTLVKQVADFVVVMHRGEIIERGTREEVLDSPQHVHTRHLLSSVRDLESAFRDVQSGAGS